MSSIKRTQSNQSNLNDAICLILFGRKTKRIQFQLNRKDLPLVRWNIFYLDIFLLPWCDIFYRDIILLPWWNLSYLDIILLPWCDILYLDIILLPWWNISYLDIILLPWWNIFYLDIFLLPWCDILYLDIIVLPRCDIFYLDFILLPWCIRPFLPLGWVFLYRFYTTVIRTSLSLFSGGGYRLFSATLYFLFKDCPPRVWK